MEKALYISFLNEEIRPGYKKKIHSQAAAISEQGYETLLIIICNQGVMHYRYKAGQLESQYVKAFSRARRSVERNIMDELVSFRDFDKAVRTAVSQERYDCVYVRRIVPITPALISLLKYIKKTGAKIIYEYPRYPWKEEMKSRAVRPSRKLFYFLDCMFYEKLLAIPDMIAYLGVYNGSDRRFFLIQNCGRASDFPCKTTQNHGKDIHLIEVAHAAYTHGYDLMVEAMKDYYAGNPERKVYFHIVGTTKGAPEIEKLTKEYHLEEYVIFHGFKTGRELDALYEMADIGVNKIRIDVESTKTVGLTTLKTVEYTFRGLPQISCAGFRIDRNKVDIPDFLLIFEEGSFQMRDVFDFYDSLKESPAEIREYAENHMSWNKVYSDVFERLQELT